MYIHRHHCESKPKLTNMQSLSIILQAYIQLKKRQQLVYAIICRTLVLHFLVLKDVIISCFYFSNDIVFVFMIAVATMDNNAEILRVISHLREFGYAWRGREELRCSLSASLLTIFDTIARSNDALYSITS